MLLADVACHVTCFRENLSVSRAEVCAKVIFVNCLLVFVLSCLATPSLFLNQINKLKPIKAIASSVSCLLLRRRRLT